MNGNYKVGKTENQFRFSAFSVWHMEVSVNMYTLSQQATARAIYASVTNIKCISCLHAKMRTVWKTRHKSQMQIKKMQRGGMKRLVIETDIGFTILSTIEMGTLVAFSQNSAEFSLNKLLAAVIAMSGRD